MKTWYTNTKIIKIQGVFWGKFSRDNWSDDWDWDFGEETIIFKELTDNNRCRKLTYFKRKHDPISDVVYGYFKCEILGNRKFYFESKNSKLLKIIELDDIK